MAPQRMTAPNAWDVGDLTHQLTRRTRPSNRPYSLILGSLCATVFLVSFGLQLLANYSKPTVEPKKPTLAVATAKGEPNVKHVDPVPAVVEPTMIPPKPKPDPVKPGVTPKPKPDPVLPVVTPKPTPEPAKPVDPPMATTAPAKPPEVKKPVEPPKVTAVSFAKVLPILQSKCIDCHGGALKKNGLDLKTIASITKGGTGGAGIKPGEPDNSYLMEKINDMSMPPPNKTPLTEDEKKLIRDWIAGGAK